MLLFTCYGIMMMAQIKFLLMFAAGVLFVNQKQSNRSILIFADKFDNAYAIQQINILKADPAGIKDRDLVFQVITYSQSNMAHYKKYGVINAGFTVLLIGKDNGEKLRSHQPVSLTKLFDVIDNMPMRREEVHYKN